MDALHPLPVTAPDLRLGESIVAYELASADARSSTQVAAAAARSWEKLARHFSRIIGELGIRTLLRRSLLLTRSAFPWLEVIDVNDARPPWITLQATLERRDPDEAARAFAELLATCIRLIARFIGESLVAQLLQEIWPGVIARGDEETT